MKERIITIIVLFLAMAVFINCHDNSHQTKMNQNIKVTYASLIKLKHLHTNFWLHAHDIRIQRGGIYSVTAYRQDDHGSFWQILEQYDSPKKTKTYKDVVKCGDTITLYSSIVNYYLRTQDTTFGLTTQLLPLVHGIQKDQIDHGVAWNIQCVDKQNGQQLNFKDKIRLKHDTSGKYVSTDGSSYYTEGNCGRGCQIAGQLQLHAVDNGHYSQHTVFQIVGGLSFDQEFINKQTTKEQ